MTPIDKRGFDELTVVTPEPQEMSEYEYAQRVSQLMADSEEVWSIVKEEAEEALAKNPDDEIAKAQLLRWQNWKRQTTAPTDKLKSGLNLVKQPKRLRGSKYGSWVRDKRHGWLIRAAGATVGDTVPIHKRDGTTEQVRLTECVFANFFKGVKR